MGRLPCAATDVATTVDSPTTTHAYATKGHYPAVLRIKDAVNPSGVTATPITITVTTPPVAQLAVTPSPSNAGDSITLDAAGSNDPDGNIVDLFAPLLGWLDHVVAEGLLKPKHRELLLVADTVGELLDRLESWRPAPAVVKWATPGER